MKGLKEFQLFQSNQLYNITLVDMLYMKKEKKVHKKTEIPKSQVISYLIYPTKELNKIKVKYQNELSQLN